jgi:uncharacterized UPF0160 family protein
MSERRDPSGSHVFPPLVLREDVTGSHRTLPPDSEPPVSARGLSWKAVLSVASILFALAGSVGTYLYTHAEAEAEQRARHREVITRLDRIEEDVAAMAGRLADSEREVHEQRTQFAVFESSTEARIAGIDRELEKIERRRRGER